MDKGLYTSYLLGVVYTFYLVNILLLQFLFRFVSSLLLLGTLMSDSDSSDTTHEAILHNVVSHVLHLRQQVAQIRTDLSQLSDQLSQLQASVQILVQQHGSQFPTPVEQKATTDQQH